MKLLRARRCDLIAEYWLMRGILIKLIQLERAVRYGEPVPVQTVEALLDQVRARGGRITTARRVVLAELLAADSQHLSAEQLVVRVNNQHPDIHLSTIYRTLEYLEDAGILVEVRLGGDPASYHFADHVHHHAICDRCGSMIELSDSALAPMVNRLQRDYGFLAAPRHLIIGGLCQRCA
jgi:Fur family transcriptional regulator, ferric uptake regulator